MKIALALVTALTTLSGCGASPSPNPQIKPADSRAEIRPGGAIGGVVRERQALGMRETTDANFDRHWGMIRDHVLSMRNEE